jgi:hypothetical protein
MKGIRRSAMAGLFLALTVAGGCAATNSSGSEGTRSDVITRAEIMEATGIRNMYELVSRLRPRWVTMRAGDRSFGMATEIAVFQGQTYMGNIDTLRQLGHTMAYELRYLDGQTAMATLTGFGAGKHLSGAIVIVTTPPAGGP